MKYIGGIELEKSKLRTGSPYHFTHVFSHTHTYIQCTVHSQFIFCCCSFETDPP
jgi:hypothetical protein